MTSPFLLAQKPKEEQQPRPIVGQAERKGPSFSIPLQSKEPAKLDVLPMWQQKVEEQHQQFQQQDLNNSISPQATKLREGYNNLFPIIQAIGDTALAGQQASSAVQSARKAAIERARLDELNRQAVQDAYNRTAGLANPGVATGGGGVSSSYQGDVVWDGSEAAIADMMRKAGFPDSAIAQGLGVAFAESSFNPNAVSKTNDYGLFQINKRWHPEFFTNGYNVFDPQQNINAAFKIWNASGRTFAKDWTTFGTPKAAPRAVPATRLTAVPGQVGGVVSTGNGTLRNQAVNKAMIALHLPYAWGGNSLTTGVDCSGLVQQVYKSLGISTPRQARAQAAEGAVGHRVGSINDLQPGDLIAFQWAGGYAGPNTVSHIAIYAGNGEIIEEYGPDGTVGRRRALRNTAQDRGAIFIHVRFPGE